MIRFEELHVLMCYALAALFVYHSAMYFMLTNRFRAPKRFRGFRFWLRGLGTLLLIIVGVGIVISLLMFGSWDLFGEPGYLLFIVPFIYLVVGVPVLIQIALAPWFGIYCYNNQEIES
jgi:amino acid transporter